MIISRLSWLGFVRSILVLPVNVASLSCNAYQIFVITSMQLLAKIPHRMQGCYVYLDYRILECFFTIWIIFFCNFLQHSGNHPMLECRYMPPST